MTRNPFFIATVENILLAVPHTLRLREEMALSEPEMERVTADEIAMHTALVERCCAATATQPTA